MFKALIKLKYNTKVKALCHKINIIRDFSNSNYNCKKMQTNLDLIIK